MPTSRVAEICAGYGGMHLALQQAGYDVALSWYAEKDPDASTVMAHHHDIPNLGDITTVDWAKAAPVDIITAGWPCQPFSLAGKRKGYEDDRAIWDAVAGAVRVLRPRLFLGENVPGHLARGQLGRVVAELAGIGYVGSWLCLRASDLGAPHQRNRVFLAAYPADTDRESVWPELVRLGTRRDPAVTGNDREGSGLVELLPTPGARLGDGRGAPGADLAEDRYASGRRNLDDAVATPAARDAEHGAGWTDREGRPLSETVMRLRPTPTAADGIAGPGQGVTAQGSPNLRTEVTLLPTPRASDGDKGGPNQRGSSGDLALPAAVQPGRWGQYTTAITRWERNIGRPAPPPTEPGRRGAPRLSPLFVEWMMGLPEGHVTGLVGRNAALRVLGNGLVPAQGALAFRTLDPARLC